MLDILADFIEPGQRFWQMGRVNGFLITTVAVIYRHIPESLFHAKGFIIVTGEPHAFSADQNSNHRVRPATLNDLDLLSNCGYPQSVLRRWFKGGAHAWLIEHEGQLLACYWLDGNDRYYLYDWLAIKSAPTDAWVLWWWVAPEHRRRDLAYQVRSPGVSEFARAGYLRILGAIDTLNRNAIRACQKMGWKTIGRLFILRILGITVVRYGWSVRVGRWNSEDLFELRLVTS